MTDNLLQLLAGLARADLALGELAQSQASVAEILAKEPAQPHERAARVPDEVMSRSFLGTVPWNRELVAECAWRQGKGGMP